VRPGPSREQTTAIKTFLIADIRGYTTFTQERGDEAAAELATTFADLVRTRVDEGGGTLIELRGDEALAVFDSARQAIRTAVELQLRLVEKTVAEPRLPLGVGIGLDAGEAVAVDGGFRGGALNLAARLCSLAGAGEILATREVAHLTRKVDGIKYVERGSARLKGLAEPIDIVTVRPEYGDPAQDLTFLRALGARARPKEEGLGTRNPYKGLRAFEEADAADFFGREALTRHLVERLERVRFLAVVGPSGSGKSSVVRAGLVPALRAGAFPGTAEWAIVDMFPGAHPLEDLEAALLRVAANPPPSLMEQLEDEDGRGLIRAVKRILPSGTGELLLVLDQLEELFTLVDDEGQRTRFLALLERAVSDPRSRLRVVATLRADYYDRPLQYSGFAELLRDYVEALVPLTPDEFERAIVEPARRGNTELEPGLLAEMVADVASEPGALPLLQYALTELYEQREGNVLTVEAYRRIGGVSGALAGRAEDVFSSLAPESQEAARQLLLRLVTLGEGAEDTRRRVDRGELSAMEVDQEALAEAIDAFGTSRLLSFDRDPRTASPTVEVAHEALLRVWGRLRSWIDSAREDLRVHRRLAVAASEWTASGRDASFLVRGSNLAQFEVWSETSRVALTGAQREFVAASAAASRGELTRQRRQNRRLRGLLAGVAGLLAIAVAAGVLALLSRASAQREARVALARDVGAEALSEPRLDRAMLLAREAVNLNGSPQTSGTLLATLLRSPAAVATFTTQLGLRPQRIAVSPDGRTLAVATNSSTLSLYDTATHRLRHVIRYFGYTQRPTYNADGTEIVDFGGVTAPEIDVVATRSYRIVRRLNLDTRLLTLPTSDAAGFAVSGAGTTLYHAYAVLKPDGTEGAGWVDRWDLRSGKLLPSIAVGALGVTAASLVDHDGRYVVIGSRTATVFSTRPFHRIASVTVPAGTGAVSPDGRTVVVGTSSGTVSFADLKSGATRPATGAQGAAIEAVAFSPDGRTAVTGADDGSVIVWDARTGKELERLVGHAGRVLGAAFSRDAKTLYTSSLDGAIFEWDLGTSRRFGVPFVTSRTRAPAPGTSDVPYTPPLALAPDGAAFAIRMGFSRVGIFSTKTLRLLTWFAAPGSSTITAIAWSRGGLVTAGPSGRVNVWTAQPRPKLAHVLTGLREVGRPRPVLELRYGLDSEPQQLVTVPETVEAVASSPSGSFVAAADVDHHANNRPPLARLALWNASSGKLRWLLDLKNESIGGEGAHAVAFAPDGRTIAAGLDDGRVRIVDVSDGRIVRTIGKAGGGETSGIVALAFAPNGTLATGSWAGVVQLWNPRTGKELARPTEVAAAPVASIAFSRDGRTLATTGGSDGLAKIWSASTLQNFASTSPGDPGHWGNAVYTPDDRELVVVYDDGTGFRWPSDLHAWERHACAVAGRNLTREEWAHLIPGHPYHRVCAASQ